MYEVIFKLCYNYRNRALRFHACVHALKSLIRPCSISDSVAALCVASRTIIGSLVEQVRMGLMPLFHGLHRRLALEC